MACVLKQFVDDENAEVIESRPDINGQPDFGVTTAKKHPPFVFAIRGVSCLVHKIARVEMHWYRVGRHGHALVKLKRPAMFAITNCSQHFMLQGDRSRTCQLPSPDALLCGRCHGEVATFGKHGPATKAGIKRQVAHVKLGCAVKGY